MAEHDLFGDAQNPFASTATVIASNDPLQVQWSESDPEIVRFETEIDEFNWKRIRRVPPMSLLPFLIPLIPIALLILWTIQPEVEFTFVARRRHNLFSMLSMLTIVICGIWLP